MIRRSLPEGDLLIAQADHALQAGRFAALFAGPRPPAAVRAAAIHDAGWPLLDDEPAPLPDGRPPHFLDLGAAASAPAWRRSIEIAAAYGAAEALLVSRHFSAFSDEFRGEQAPSQAAWRARVDPAFEEEGWALVRLCDAISLKLLCDPETPLRLPAPYRMEGSRLDPWPFALPRVVDVIAGRLLPRRKWSSQRELAAAYQVSPPHPLTLQLEPF